LGLIFYGTAALKERALPTRNSGLLVVMGIVYVGGFIAIGVIGGRAQLFVITGWAVLFSSGWLVLGYFLASEADTTVTTSAGE